MSTAGSIWIKDGKYYYFDDNLKIINELLTSEPTIEMKNVYDTENINDIRMQWNETIELALKATMLKGKNKEIIARILDKILIKK